MMGYNIFSQLRFNNLLIISSFKKKKKKNLIISSCSSFPFYAFLLPATISVSIDFIARFMVIQQLEDFVWWFIYKLLSGCLLLWVSGYLKPVAVIGV